MELDDLKRVWEKQGRRAQLGFDEQNVIKKVTEKHARITLLITVFELTAIVTLLGLSIFALVKGLTHGEYYQMPIVLLFFGLAAYLFLDRKKRLKMCSCKGSSVLDEVESSIAQLQYQIKRQQNIHIWFFLPATCVAMYQFFFSSSDHRLLTVIVCGCGLVITYYLTQNEIRCKLQPKLKEMQALQRLLTKAP